MRFFKRYLLLPSDFVRLMACKENHKQNLDNSNVDAKQDLEHDFPFYFTSLSAGGGSRAMNHSQELGAPMMNT